jgi:membrane protein YqaA with SNARE-associated domain
MSLSDASSDPAASEKPAASPPPKDVKYGITRRLYDWVLKWADTPYALPMLCLISFAEASFFPIPPDVLLLPMCFAKPKQSLKFAAYAVATSVIGGCLGYYIGFALWSQFHDFFIPRFFTQVAFDTVKATYQDHAFTIIAAKGLTPIPFKLVTISAGVANVDLKTFIAASIVCRSIRFFAEGVLIYFFGEKVRPFVEKYLSLLMLGFLVLLIGGFVALKMLK